MNYKLECTDKNTRQKYIIEFKNGKLLGNEFIVYTMQFQAELFDKQYIGYYPNVGTYTTEEHLKDIYSILIILQNSLGYSVKVLGDKLPKLWHEVAGSKPEFK